MEGLAVPAFVWLFFGPLTAAVIGVPIVFFSVRVLIVYVVRCWNIVTDARSPDFPDD